MRTRKVKKRKGGKSARERIGKNSMRRKEDKPDDYTAFLRASYDEGVDGDRCGISTYFFFLSPNNVLYTHQALHYSPDHLRTASRTLQNVP